MLLKHVQKLTPSPTVKGKLPPLPGSETTKAGNAKKFKLPERTNKRSVSNDAGTIKVEQDDSKIDEATSTGNERTNGEEKENVQTEEAKPNHHAHEEIADEIESPKKDEKLNVKSENKIPSKTNVDKAPLEKKNTLQKQPTLKVENDIKNNPDKKDTLVNIDNKPKEVAGSQNTVVDKKESNSKNPSKTDIKDEKKL